MSLTSRGYGTVSKLTGMASLVFRLRGRSPHNSPLVVGPRALAKVLNQKGGAALLRIVLAPFGPRPALGRLFRRRTAVSDRPPA